MRIMQAAAKQAPKLSKEEMVKMRQAHDPNFKKKQEQEARDKKQQQQQQQQKKKPAGKAPAAAKGMRHVSYPAPHACTGLLTLHLVPTPKGSQLFQTGCAPCRF